MLIYAYTCSSLMVDISSRLQIIHHNSKCKYCNVNRPRLNTEDCQYKYHGMHSASDIYRKVGKYTEVNSEWIRVYRGYSRDQIYWVILLSKYLFKKTTVFCRKHCKYLSSHIENWMLLKFGLQYEIFLPVD